MQQPWIFQLPRSDLLTVPTAAGAAGLGWGFQAGAQSTDIIIALETKEAVEAYRTAGQLKVGGDMHVTAGDKGAGNDAGVTSKGFTAYTHSHGLFGGISIDGMALVARNEDNAAVYGKDVTVQQVLDGAVTAPPEAAELYRLLEDLLEVGELRDPSPVASPTRASHRQQIASPQRVGRSPADAPSSTPQRLGFGTDAARLGSSSKLLLGGREVHGSQPAPSPAAAGPKKGRESRGFTLTFSKIRAHNVPDADATNGSDPYLTFRIAEGVPGTVAPSASTTPIRNSRHPAWKDPLVLEVRLTPMAMRMRMHVPCRGCRRVTLHRPSQTFTDLHRATYTDVTTLGTTLPRPEQLTE